MESNLTNYQENRQKRRVLFVITQNEIGGAQRFLAMILNNIDTKKFEPALAYGDTSSDNYFANLDKFSVFKLKNLKREPNVLSDVKSIFELRRIIKRFQPDTLFLCSSKAGFIGSLASVFPLKIRGLKVIYRIGGWSFNDPWPKFKKWLWIQLEKISARWKDIIIVNNLHDLNQAERLKIRPRNEVVLIYNGLDVYKTEFLPPDEARLRLFEKISKYSGKVFQTKYIIGAIANFYSTKGIKYFIQAASKFRGGDDFVFVVIGDGEERKLYEFQIKESGLQNKFFLIGRLEDAYKYLSALDVFVLPSVKEGFPWALIEAMSAKLPVIATNVGAVPEIIEDEKNGFIIEPRKPDQIAERIKLIVSDDHLRQELGIQAHQTVLFKFTLDKMIKQIEDLL